MDPEDVAGIVDTLEELLHKIDTLPWTSSGSATGKFMWLPSPAWKAWIDGEVANAKHALFMYNKEKHGNGS